MKKAKRTKKEIAESLKNLEEIRAKVTMEEADQAKRFPVREIRLKPTGKSEERKITQTPFTMFLEVLEYADEIKKGQRQKRKNGGAKSKRKPDKTLASRANEIIIKIRKEKNYPDSYSFEGHTQKSVFALMKKAGFPGSEGYVKKHFATITKVNVSSKK